MPVLVAMAWWATTPDPSPVTFKPFDHALLFTYGVPSRSRILNVRKSKNPGADMDTFASSVVRRINGQTWPGVGSALGP